MIADETRSAMDPSGIRFGTPAMTTRGMKEKEATRLAELMIETLRHRNDAAKKAIIKSEITEICLAHPVPESFV
jgi:glycine hydroxymethyltransferase